MISFKKAALVTGAAHGIGQAVGRRLLRDGFYVAFADQNAALLKKTVSELRSPECSLALPMNVARENNVRQGIAQLLKKFGRLDVLVNNAGIAQPVSKLDVQRWNTIISVNLTGAFLCAKYAAPHLRKTKGSLINMASTRALMSEPDTEAYSASKGGLVALTHSLAISLGPDIRVNCISPGWIQTDSKTKLRPIDHEQHPVGRVGRPDDVAALVSYLASEEAGFVTGQNFIIDGGMTRKMIYAE
jgi:NAD(P)-dependent dehydrogenase (short-subunit alcohol dehydrogenase family)